jgi:hypothetical protein
MFITSGDFKWALLVTLHGFVSDQLILLFRFYLKTSFALCQVCPSHLIMCFYPHFVSCFFEEKGSSKSRFCFVLFISITT